MKYFFYPALIILALLTPASLFAVDSNIDSSWRAGLKQASNSTELGTAMSEAFLACAPAQEVVKAALEAGHDPYEVVRIGIDPGTCGGGCICGVVRAAAAAGVSPDLVAKAASELGVDPEAVARSQEAVANPPADWRASFRQALENDKDLAEAIAGPIEACIPPSEVVKAALDLGQDPYLAVRLAIGAAGGACICDAVAGAYAAGIPVTVIERAAFDACACPAPVAASAPLPAPPPVPLQPVVRERIVLRGINFDYDRFNIKPEFAPILDVAAAILKAHPELRVMVEGHACAMGTDVYNQRLSERRAKAVRDYLVTKGVTAGMLLTVGYGESKPMADNDTEEGRRLNRRVEFKIIE